MTVTRAGERNRTQRGTDPALLQRCDELARRLRGAGVDPALVHADQVISLLAAEQDAIVVWEQLMARGSLALRLADAVELAQVKRLVTKREIEAAVARSPRRRGAGVLRELAADPAFTRSRAERKVVALVRAAGLPEPSFNAIVDGWELDAVWRRERVVLEFDSYAFHATRGAFERDRRKTAELTRRRYVVLRTTWTELTRRSHFLVARIAEALALNARAVP